MVSFIARNHNNVNGYDVEALLAEINCFGEIIIMKFNKTLASLLLSMAIVACNSGSNAGQSQQLDANHTALSGVLADSSVKDYVNQLASVKVDNGNQSVEQLRQQLIAYYSKVPVVQTVEAKGYTVDCIPFDQQPGLINASAADKATAEVLNKQHLAAMAKAGNSGGVAADGFDFKSNMCPESTVAIARMDADNLSNYIKVLPSQLLISEQNQNDSNHQNYPTDATNNGNVTLSPGYSWIQSYLSNGESAAPAGYSVSFLSPDPALSNKYMPTNSNGHSLNQLWWLDKQNTSSFVYSLETGWITEAINQQTSTELFVFSTTDGYTGGSSNDQYNQAGGFIQYSDTPATVGTPLTTSQKFTLSFVLLPNNSGYELRYSANGTTQGMGFYLMSRFPTQPNFNYNWYGSEVADGCGLPITMGGTITGAGILDESGNVLQSYLPAQTTANILGEFSFSYNFNSDGSITYSGTNSLNPSPTPAPSGQPTGVYTAGASAINWDGSHLSAVYNGVTTPVLDYVAVCASGSEVGRAKGILSCYSYNTTVQNLTYNESFSQGFWPNSCFIQDLNVDTSISGCSTATPQSTNGACISQVHAYCQNSNGAYGSTSLDLTGSGCYNSASQQWNIALNSDGQLYCPSSNQ